MKARILKAFIGILVLVISPLFMVVVIGTLYNAFHMITGYSMIEGFYSYTNFIRSFVPYFSYLTTVLIVILTLIFFRKQKKPLEMP
ncbi:MAG: hypothetical protein H6Q58_425 [Firmicutes bacterium]|nr:hypothetical protein [Bacillota bacterium]